MVGPSTASHTEWQFSRSNGYRGYVEVGLGLPVA